MFFEQKGGAFIRNLLVQSQRGPGAKKMGFKGIHAIFTNTLLIQCYFDIYVRQAMLFVVLP